MSTAAKEQMIQYLRRELLAWQGYKAPPAGKATFPGLELLESAFPNAHFPLGAVHEFISETPEQAAATGGFIGGLLGSLMHEQGVCLWISAASSVYPPALTAFGIAAERIIFIDTPREKELLWTIEEALKCRGVSAVIGELKQINFAQSRRLQLAVEKSSVTAFLLCSRETGATCSAARWKIASLPSETEEGLPGLGFPRWNATLLKVRNGHPGSWTISWSEEGFSIAAAESQAASTAPSHLAASAASSAQAKQAKLLLQENKEIILPSLTENNWSKTG